MTYSKEATEARGAATGAMLAVPATGGGSAPGGGKANRLTTPGGGFTSYSQAAKENKQRSNASNPHKIVNGKNILNTYDGVKGIEQVIHAQGFDGKPRVVSSQEEFDRLCDESSFVAQRGYKGSSQKVADEYQRQLYEGEFYTECRGGATFGHGMYCMADFTGKISDKVTNVASSYAGISKSTISSTQEGEEPASKIETFTLDKSARIIRYSDLRKLYNGQPAEGLIKEKIAMEYAKKIAPEYEIDDNYAKAIAKTIVGDLSGLGEYLEYTGKDGGKTATAIAQKYGAEMAKEYKNEYESEREKASAFNGKARGYNDIGVYAAALGYDAFCDGDGLEIAETVILNRTKMILLDSRGKRDSADDERIAFQIDDNGIAWAIRDSKVVGYVIAQGATPI